MSDTLLRVRTGTGGLLGTGLLGTGAAIVATAAGAALARAAGVPFEVPVGGESIPVSGVAFVTGVLSLVGVGLALALLRWSGRPAERFWRTAVLLTAVSLVPPFVVGASLGTALALVGLHLLAAAVMVPTLTHGLRARSAATLGPSA